MLWDQALSAWGVRLACLGCLPAYEYLYCILYTMCGMEDPLKMNG